MVKKYHKAYGPLCPRCKERMLLLLPPGGSGPRLWRCESCDQPDPLKMRSIDRLLHSRELRAPKGK